MGKKNEKQAKDHKVNGDIRHKRVFAVFDDKGIKEVMDTTKALRLAEDNGLDLVMMNETDENPVCKIMDYNKFMYNKKKNDKNNKKQKQQEMRFTPNIGEHDIDVKVNKIRKFLEKGNTAKLIVFFKGREKADPDQGKYVLLTAINKLEDAATVDKMPKMEQNKMEAIIKPKTNKKDTDGGKG